MTDQLVADRELGENLGRPVAAQRARAAEIPHQAPPDDLAREVYCVLGMPLDAIDSSEVLRRIRAAAANSAAYWVSTPNVNFLVHSQAEASFNETLLHSDLSIADGMPIVWIARIMGLPIRERIAGSDLFDMLQAQRSVLPLKTFLFGGRDDAAVAAADAINAQAGGMNCVGTLNPGYGTIEEMSTDEILDLINKSGASFLVVALNAVKGQGWLQRNRDRLQIAVRAQLGAVVNYHAGSVQRAPPRLRKLGLEWLWRIMKEPYLWRRFAHDGVVLAYLFLSRVLPLAVSGRWQRSRYSRRRPGLQVTRSHVEGATRLSLAGEATAEHVGEAITWFKSAIQVEKSIIVELSATRVIDARFIGFLFMVRKLVSAQGGRLILSGVSRKMGRALRLHGADYLMSSDGVA